MPQYRVAINGFRVQAETWDDAAESDGKRDEVFLSTSVVLKDKLGKTIYENTNRSPVIGDVNNQPGRIQGGTATDFWGSPTRGGFRSGDVFPDASPWIRKIALSAARDYPPNAVWQGSLKAGENVVFITPTIWEWDPGQNFWQGWLSWHQQIDVKFGPTAKEIVAGKFPPFGPIFDAVSLGIQTAATLTAYGPIGNSGERPIGFMQTAAGGNDYEFVSKTLVLTEDVADAIANSQPAGLGSGILSIPYTEHPYFRGDYTLYLQVERMGEDPPVHLPNPIPDMSMWREASDDKTYVVVGGAKFRADQSYIDSLGGPKKVTKCVDGDLNNVPLIPKDGTFLREHHGSQIFEMKNGKKSLHWGFSGLGRTSRGVILRVLRIVPDGGLNQIPLGDATIDPSLIPKPVSIIRGGPS
jgi:hypothetical protein